MPWHSFDECISSQLRLFQSKVCLSSRSGWASVIHKSSGEKQVIKYSLAFVKFTLDLEAYFFFFIFQTSFCWGSILGGQTISRKFQKKEWKDHIFQVCSLMMFKRSQCRWLKCEPTGRVFFNLHLKWGPSLREPGWPHLAGKMYVCA